MGCFQLLAILNNAAKNILVQTAKDTTKQIPQ